MEPERFEAGSELQLKGLDLGETQEVCFGEVCIPPDEARPDRVTITIPLPPPDELSARSYPITAVRVLPSGRRFSSNAVMGRLLPTLNTATPGTLTSSGSGLIGDLTLAGERLGGPDDSIFVAFYRDGSVALMLEATGTTAQTSLTVSVTADNSLASGLYLIILRVNGEQPINAPEVNWA